MSTPEPGQGMAPISTEWMKVSRGHRKEFLSAKRRALLNCLNPSRHNSVPPGVTQPACPSCFSRWESLSFWPRVYFSRCCEKENSFQSTFLISRDRIPKSTLTQLVMESFFVASLFFKCIFLLKERNHGGGWGRERKNWDVFRTRTSSPWWV